jgi:hypothetical protein
MKFTDTNRLDFLEKWETSSHSDSWFTILTQHVRKADCATLRDFCDYGIDFEKMIDSNELDVISWHYMPLHLQEMVVTIWEDSSRPLSEEEKVSLQEEATRYWEELHQIEEESSDK